MNDADRAHWESEPVEAALAWATCVLEHGDLRSVWPRTDRRFRLVLAQAWVESEGKKGEKEALAAALAEDEPEHAAWPTFEAATVTLLRGFHPRFDSETWGVGSKPRPIRLDCEAVRFVEGVDAAEIATTDELADDAQILVVLVRLTPGGYVVAGLAEEPSRPGWPPLLSVAVNPARDEAVQDVVRAHGFRPTRSHAPR